jgi:hypothetical protein
MGIRTGTRTRTRTDKVDDKAIDSVDSPCGDKVTVSFERTVIYPHRKN